MVRGFSLQTCKNIKNNDMRISLTAIYAAVIFLSMMPFADLSAQERQGKEPDVMEMAEQEADRLQRILDLEDWQVFYVDSTLKYNFPAMQKEFMTLKGAKVTNSSIYQSVQDKWMEKTDSSYMRIFNEDQWAAYLKSGAAKQRKAREKRRVKAEAALQGKK